jgi:hypothetical protein
MRKTFGLLAAMFTIIALGSAAQGVTLVADYQFATSAAVATDSSGNMFTGVNHGAVQGNTSEGGGYISVSGGAYFATPNLSSPGPGPLGTSDTSVSISTWFKAAPGGGNGVIVDELGGPDTTSGWHDSQIELETNGNVATSVWPYSLQLKNGSISPGLWYQATLVYNSSSGGTLTEYIDGAQVGTGAFGGRQAPWNGNGFSQFYAFGPSDTTTMGNGVSFDGLIGDTRIYNGALSAADVLAVFDATEGGYVPEPSSYVALVGLGGMGLLLFARRRRQA